MLMHNTFCTDQDMTVTSVSSHYLMLHIKKFA